MSLDTFSILNGSAGRPLHVPLKIDASTIAIANSKVVAPRRVGDWRKRALDIVLALAAIVVLLPLALIIIMIIKIASPGPVLYGHERVGRNGRIFKCLKFRTMAVNGDELLKTHFAASPSARFEWERSRKLKDDPRVTAIGAILRKTSADELPQLINILRGDMSVVGPRPVIREEICFYGEYAGHYFAARPGLTGLWQVSGRSDVSYEARVDFDRLYCENWSMAKDCAIILRTVPAVLSRRGTY